MVSITHVANLPGRGWAPTGDASALPEWPEAPTLDELFEEAGLDGGLVAQALGGSASNQDEGDGNGADGADDTQVARALSQQEQAAVIDRAAASTRALMRAGSSGKGWELRLHSSLPFGGVYAFDAAHAVAGWGHDGQGGTGAGLWQRTDCPPPVWPDATHNYVLALSHDPGGGLTLEHSGYGWWAVAPVGRMPERIVAYKSGLSFGEPATAAPQAGTEWTGRVSGHVFWEQQRWALGGDITLELATANGQPRLAGRIHNTEMVPLDLDTLQPNGPAVRWRTLTLDAASPVDGAWTGQISVGPAHESEPPNMPLPESFLGDWLAAAYGPNSAEVAGRLRLWTSLANDDDPATDWPAQAVIVAGFGGTNQ